MDKIKEIEINNLIDLRKCYYTTVVLICTGVFGLFFVNISIFKLITLLTLGLVASINFLLNLIEKDK